MSKPILLVDFDGVIHSYISGWRGAAEIPDPPVDGAAAFLASAVNHFEVKIYSARSSQPGGLEAMKRFCLEHFGAIITNHLGFPSYKPSAFLTIDDRCICFNGNFPNAESLLDFKPWNKRDV